MTTTTTATVWACPVCRQEVGVLWTSGPPVCNNPAHPQAIRRHLDGTPPTPLHVLEETA